MNQNYNYNMNYKLPNNPPFNNQYRPNNNDRFIGGGFLGPFILGGLTGGLVAPFFYGNNRPNYNYYYPYPTTYYYCGYYR